MPDWLIPLLTLTAMEVVLGIDNVIFLAIIVSKLPPSQQARVKWIGIGLAALMRVGLILCIKWIMGLTFAVFTLTQLGVPESWLRPNPASLSIEDQEEAKQIAAAHPEMTSQSIEAFQQMKAEDHFNAINNVTWRDIILLAGGLFLIAKATYEIHDKLEAKEHVAGRAASSVAFAIAQVVAIDLIFSLDSVITAIGMVREVWVMIVAMLTAVGVMIVFASPISAFVNRHPSMKMLALAFLILIGVMLVAEGFGQHLDKGYIYFAMAFSVTIEMFNIRMRSRQAVVLHNAPPLPPGGAL